MSDEPTTVAADESSTDFTPITSQESLDKIIGQRIARVKNQYSDYDELKTKASRFDELEQSQKTELQKLQERLAATEKDLATERTAMSRSKFAETRGVPASALSGDSEEMWDQQATDLLTWRGAQPKTPRPAGLKSGATNTDTRLDPKERAAAALRQLRAT